MTRGRTPFPASLFAIAIIGILAALIVPLSLRLLSESSNQEVSLSPDKEAAVSEDFDPFGDKPWIEPEAEQIRVVTKFVEVGSTTEELSFDWIASPFHLESDPPTSDK